MTETTNNSFSESNSLYNYNSDFLRQKIKLKTFQSNKLSSNFGQHLSLVIITDRFDGAIQLNETILFRFSLKLINNNL